MLVEFFILGNMAFWILMSFILLLGFICVAQDDFWELLIVSSIVVSAILLLTSDLPSRVTLKMLLYIPAWLVIGLVWSLPRWIIFLRKGKRAFDAAVKDAQPYSIIKATQEWGFSYADGKLTPPIAKEHTSRIVAWIILWPWSLVWTAIGDGVVRLTRWVVEKLSGLYQRISEYVYE